MNKNYDEISRSILELSVAELVSKLPRVSSEHCQIEDKVIRSAQIALETQRSKRSVERVTQHFRSTLGRHLESLGMTLSVGEEVHTNDAFLAIEDLVDGFEQQLAAGQSSRVDTECCLLIGCFNTKRICLRSRSSRMRWRCCGYGWKFNLLEVPSPPYQTLYRICPEVEFSAHSIEMLHYELQRLRASDQEQGKTVDQLSRGGGELERF